MKNKEVGGWAIPTKRLTPKEARELKATGYVIRKDGTIITTLKKHNSPD